MNRDLAAGLIRLLCGVRPIADEACPAGVTLYFANHSSHLDFVTIWAALPATVRSRTRPVAGRDYWEKTRVRRWLAGKVFRAVLIDRQRTSAKANPLEPILAALTAGESLIVFPEGTRSIDGTVHEFKGGLFSIAKQCPEVALVPVYLQDLNRILPKGDVLPVPLIASLSVGDPIRLGEGELKPAFLSRARDEIVRLARPSA